MKGKRKPKRAHPVIEQILEEINSIDKINRQWKDGVITEFQFSNTLDQLLVNLKRHQTELKKPRPRSLQKKHGVRKMIDTNIAIMANKKEMKKLKDKDEKCYFCLKGFEEVGGKFYVFIDKKMRRAHKKCHSQHKIETRKTNITVIMK